MASDKTTDEIGWWPSMGPGSETNKPLVIYTPPYRSYITNCVLISDHKGPPLFSDGGDVKVCIDHYAIIPRELFDAMGGEDHPAYREWCQRTFREYWTPERIAAASLAAEERGESADDE